MDTFYFGFKFNNEVYFSGWQPATAQELWKTDGTDVGTVEVVSSNDAGEPFQLNKAIEYYEKVLALELLLSTLETSGNSFRTGERFIQAIKKRLCPALIQNCLSSTTRVASLSLRIFVVLITTFSEHLKKELEVFFIEKADELQIDDQLR